MGSLVEIRLHLRYQIISATMISRAFWAWLYLYLMKDLKEL